MINTMVQFLILSGSMYTKFGIQFHNNF